MPTEPAPKTSDAAGLRTEDVEDRAGAGSARRSQGRAGRLGRSASTFTASSRATAYEPNDDWPKKRAFTGVLSSEYALLPSVRRPPKRLRDARRDSRRGGRDADAQSRRCSSRTRTTWSPSARRVSSSCSPPRQRRRPRGRGRWAGMFGRLVIAGSVADAAPNDSNETPSACSAPRASSAISNRVPDSRRPRRHVHDPLRQRELDRRASPASGCAARPQLVPHPSIEQDAPLPPFTCVFSNSWK